CRTAHLHITRNVISPATLEMTDQTKRRERPHKESRIGNGVGDTGTTERGKRIKSVAEAVGPIRRDAAGAEAAAFVTRGCRRLDRRGVIQYIVLNRVAKTNKGVSYSILESACAC